MNRFEDRVFLTFVAAATLAMAWIVWPFFGAILWGLVATIVFAPVNDRLTLKMAERRSAAAAITLTGIIALVILPTVLVGSLLIDQALETYGRLRAREIDFAQLFADVEAGLPGWLTGWLERMGFGDMDAAQRKLSSVLGDAVQLAAGQAFQIGQGALGFALGLGIMLYLTFFLLRDGRLITRRIGEAVPMHPGQRRKLFEKFTTVIRATIKGSIVVAVVQGMLGGLIFWILGINAPLLWAVVMALLSLVPAVGTSLIWAPVAIYLLATGSIWQGVVLIGFGVLVIGMVDNVLRPILVGKDTRMPDYVVLISTLGGISVMGINGFIVGPVIAAMFIAAWGLLTEERAAAN